MEEKNENVVEETAQDSIEQVEETKFKSADDDNVIKIYLNKPAKPKE